MDAPEQVKKPKLKKVTRDVDQRLVDGFYKLSDPKKSIRIHAVNGIWQIIKNQPEEERGKSLNYCTDRLVRGLASSRLSSRRGFALLLIEILRNSTEVNFTEILDLADKHLRPAQNAKKEQSVALALLYSAILLSTSSRKLPVALEGVLTNLYELAKRKAYLEVLTCKMMAEVLQKNEVPAGDYVWNLVRERTNNFDLSLVSRLDLYLLLVLAEHDSKYKEKASAVAKEALKKGVVEKMIGEATQFFPTVHPICKQLAQAFQKSKRFSRFWTKCIDVGLFKSNQPAKIALGLVVVSSVFMEVNEANISVVLSSAFIQHLEQAVRNKQHKLHAVAVGQLDSIVEAAAKNEKAYYAIAAHFLEHFSVGMIKTLTQYKFFQRLVVKFEKETAFAWFELLKAKLFHVETAEDKDIHRVKLVEQISTILQCASIKDDLMAKAEIAKFFLTHSYFHSENASKEESFKTPPTDHLKACFRTCLRKALESICNSQIHLYKSNPNLEEDPMYYLAEHTYETFKSKTPSVFSKEAIKTWRKMFSDFKKARSSFSNKQLRPLLCLYCLYALHALENTEQSATVLSELNECIKRINTSAEGPLGENEPLWADVLLDLIVSLLPDASASQRTILNCVFQCIASQVTKSGLKQLSSALRSYNDDDDDSDQSDAEEAEVSDSESEQESSEQESDVSDEDLEDPDEDFRLKLMNALGPAMQKGDGEESDACVSDSEMLQLDEALAEVFRSRVSRTKLERQNEVSKTEFAMRCLDLVNIFMEQEKASLSGIVLLAKALVAIVRSSSKKCPSSLTMKVSRSLFLVSKTKNFVIDDDGSVKKSLESLLDSSLETYTQNSALNIRECLAGFIVWLVTVTKKVEPGAKSYFDKVLEVLDFSSSKSNYIVPAELFTKLVKIHPEFAGAVIERVQGPAFRTDVRDFQKYKYLRILNASFNALPKEGHEHSGLDVEEIAKKLCVSLDEAVKTDKGQYMAELLSCLATAIKRFSVSEVIKGQLEQSLPKGKRKIPPQGQHSLRDIKKLCSISSKSTQKEEKK